MRAMPNAPALVHEGLQGAAATTGRGSRGGDSASPSRRRRAVSGRHGCGHCAPAQARRTALPPKAMIEAGLLRPLPRRSTKLVVQRCSSARLPRDEQMHPVELREAVTSRRTTTRAIRSSSGPASAQRLNAIARRPNGRVSWPTRAPRIRAVSDVDVSRTRRSLGRSAAPRAEPERERLLGARARMGCRPSCGRRRTSPLRGSADLQDGARESPARRPQICQRPQLGAKVFMADSRCELRRPGTTCETAGQRVRGSTADRARYGGSYRLNDETATLVIRNRGWHMSVITRSTAAGPRRLRLRADRVQ